MPHEPDDINGLLAGAEISDVFSYGITDAASGNSSATITVTITGENDKPTAANTSLTAVDEDATHSFAAISNSMPGGDFSFMDVDVTSDSGPDVLTSVTITALPALGALALDGTAVTVGQVIPVADFSKLVFTPANLSAATHNATIGYTVTDFSSASNDTSDEATLTIPVTGGEDAPARTAAGTALNGSAQSLAVGGNASSLPHPNTLFVAVDEDDMVADGVAYGIVVRNAADAPATWLTLGTDGSFEGVVPPLADSASYTVTLTATADGEMATLSFTIGVAQGPAPVADEIAVMEGATAVTMTAASQSSVFANDLGLGDTGDTPSLEGYVVGNTYPTDGTPNVLVAGANAVGTYGTLVINDDGSFTYTLDNTAGEATDMLGAGDEEEDVFTYRVSDGQATTMAANATVTVTVQGVNDAPVYTTSTFTDSDIVEMGLNVGGDSMGEGNFTGTDVDGDTLGAQVQNPDDMSWGATAKGKFGILTIAGTAWTYTLDNQCGTTPGIQGTTADAGEAGDPGCATDALAAGDTALGESFMVRLTDGNGGESAAAALAITTIMGSNDAPALAAGKNEYPDTVIMPGMAMSDIDGERYADPESGTTLMYTPACADAVTTATLCGAGGTLPAWMAFDTTDGSFGPVTGQTVPDPFNGTMNITVTIADGEGGSVMDTFAITHRDLPPVVNADALTITEGGNDLTGNVYANDTGVRGHPMDVTTLAGYNTGATFNAGSATTDHSALRGAYGSLTIMNDGAYTYSLDNTAGSAADMLAGGQMVMDVFTYRVSDKAAGTPSGDGVITVTITGVNDTPVETTMGITPDRASVGGMYSYTIKVLGQPGVTAANADIDPVDTNDIALTFALVSATCTVPPMDGEGCTMGDSIAAPSGWLVLSPTGVFTSNRALTPADRGEYGVTITAADGAGNTLTSSTFTLTVDRVELRLGAITYNPASGQVSVPVMSSTPVPTGTGGTNSLAVTVRVSAAEGYLDPETQNLTLQIPVGESSGVLMVQLARTFGPGAMFSAELRPGAGYTLSTTTTARMGEMMIPANNEQVRTRYVEDALSGFARSMGWDVVESVRSRTRMVGGGAMQRSSIDLTGLVDYARQETAGTSDYVDVDTLLRLARSAGNGDTRQINSELLGLATQYLQSKAGPEQAAEYHSAANAANEEMAAALNEVPVGGLVDGLGVGYESQTGGLRPGGSRLGSASGSDQYAEADGHDAGFGGTATDATTDAAIAEDDDLMGDQTASAGGQPEPSHDKHGGDGVMSDPMWKGVNVWTALKQSDMSFSADSVDYDGDLRTISLGFEKVLTDNTLVGVSSNWFKGNMDFNDNRHKADGKVEIDQWVLSPYAVLDLQAARVWGTLGLGFGTMDYEDRLREGNPDMESDEADMTMNLLAAGAERDFTNMKTTEVTGRIEVMSTEVSVDGNRLHDSVDVRVHGLRGEFEFGWSHEVNGSARYRPYLVAGYRWDGGDGVTGRAFEYGGGVEINTSHLSLEGSVRLQSLENSDDYDREHYALTFSYDRDNDRRGLNLSMSNTYGIVNSVDYFSQNMSWSQAAPSSSAEVGVQTGFEAGYGIPVTGLLTGYSEAMLRPFMKANLDGDTASNWTMGLTLEGESSNIDLTHSVKSLTGGGDEQQLMLKVDFGF